MEAVWKAPTSGEPTFVDQCNDVHAADGQHLNLNLSSVPPVPEYMYMHPSIVCSVP